MNSIFDNLELLDVDKNELLTILQKHIEIRGIKETIENLRLPDLNEEDLWINEVTDMWNCSRITDVTIKILGIGPRIQIMPQTNFNSLLNRITDSELKEIILEIRKTTDITDLFNLAMSSKLNSNITKN